MGAVDIPRPKIVWSQRGPVLTRAVVSTAGGPIGVVRTTHAVQYRYDLDSETTRREREETRYAPHFPALATSYLAHSPEAAAWLVTRDRSIAKALGASRGRSLPTIADRIEVIFREIGPPSTETRPPAGEVTWVRRLMLAGAASCAGIAPLAHTSSELSAVFMVGCVMVAGGLFFTRELHRSRTALQRLEGVLANADEHLALFFATPGHEPLYRDFLTRFIPLHLRELVAPIENDRSQAQAMLGALRTQLPHLFAPESAAYREREALLTEAEQGLARADADAIGPIRALIARFEASGPLIDSMQRAQSEQAARQAFEAQLHRLLADVGRVETLATATATTVGRLASGALALVDQIDPMHAALLSGAAVAAPPLAVPEALRQLFPAAPDESVSDALPEPDREQIPES